MKILELEMKNFGKFHNKKVKFHDGMNLIYGTNEMGKTTLHSFIRGMLFGIEKQRGRAAKNDEYSLREPWENGSYFAGIMRFESGGKIFRLERNFSRKERNVFLLCETDGEELSVENGDLQVLMEGMNEDAFRNTVFFNQQSAATDEGLARELRNYMTNLQSAGDGEINVSEAVRSLEHRRKVLESQQKRLQRKKEEEIEEVRMRLDYADQEILDLQEEQKHVEVQMARIARERIKIQKQLQEKKRKLLDMQKELEIPQDTEKQREADQQEFQKKLDACREEKPQDWKLKEAFMLGGGVLAVIICIAVSNLVINILALVVWLLLSGICVFGIYRQHKEAKEREERLQLKMQEKMRQEILAERERAAKREKILEEKYQEEDELSQREKQLNLEFEKQMWNQERIQSDWKEKQVIISNLKENLEELEVKGEGLTEVEEDLDAVRLAIITLNQLSEDIYKESAAQLNQAISTILSQITEGRYTSVFLDSNMQVRINTPGKLLSLEQVSRGTMEQIYFSLRMAVGCMMSEKQPIPIILDDAFVMYDEKRLEQTLRWLYHTGRQVIIFTCHTREEQIFNKIKNEG